MKTQQSIILASMKNGQSGIVSGINGGMGMISKLEGMGIHKGARIIKKSTIFGGGPVVVMVGNTEVAMGYGMARKIIVEVDVQ